MKSKRILNRPLPAGIGRPALRALLSVGISTLEDVARSSDEELAALHGVGPKAISILREALKARPADGGKSPRRRAHG
jgi:predicted flap endonuclease-1-like 5' DNA nuclease